MKKSAIFLLLILFVSVFYACKKDYTLGGSLHDPHVDMTTYDYLKSNRLFDTLMIMVDRTGLKDELNSSATVFALTNYSISNYVKLKRDYLRVSLNDENLAYTFDSLDFPALRDSLRAYLFKEPFSLDNLTENGKFRKANDGENRLIRALPSTDYTNSNIFPVQPRYIYLTKIVATEHDYPVPTDSTGLSQVKPEQLLEARVQTSGIITNTGIVHVLNNNHTFTFFGDTHN